MEKPNLCSLTLVGSDTQPGAAFPAFTACFPSDTVIKIFEKAKAISLKIEEVSEGRSSIRLIASGKETSSFSFETQTKNAQEFSSYVDQAACFIWIVSTPSFEGRALIRVDTSEVVTRHVSERTLH